jgi:hypothetical protein
VSITPPNYSMQRTARDAAVIALGVWAVAATLTYLIGLVALAPTAALGVRLESLTGEVSVLAGAAVRAPSGAGTSPVIGTGLLIGSLFVVRPSRACRRRRARFV